jgi:hypothetical protein
LLQGLQLLARDAVLLLLLRLLLRSKSWGEGHGVIKVREDGKLAVLGCLEQETTHVIRGALGKPL